MKFQQIFAILLCLGSTSAQAFTLTINNQTGKTIVVSQALPYPVPFKQISTGLHSYSVPIIPDTLQLSTFNRLGIMIRTDVTKCSNSGPNPSCHVLQNNPGISANILLN